MTDKKQNIANRKELVMKGDSVGCNFPNVPGFKHGNVYISLSDEDETGEILVENFNHKEVMVNVGYFITPGFSGGWYGLNSETRAGIIESIYGSIPDTYKRSQAALKPRDELIKAQEEYIEFFTDNLYDLAGDCTLNRSKEIEKLCREALAEIKRLDLELTEANIKAETLQNNYEYLRHKMDGMLQEWMIEILSHYETKTKLYSWKASILIAIPVLLAVILYSMGIL